MSVNIRRAKALVRHILRDRRRSASQTSGQMMLDIEKWPQKWQDKVKHARLIALYMPIDEELHLELLLDKLSSLSIKVCFPRVEGDEMEFYEAETTEIFEKGSFSIPEPSSDSKKADPSMIDIMFVPGMAYDLSGTRLGRGKGYYDRYCGRISSEKRPLFIGVTADKNVFSAFPKDPWDLVVDALVTESSFLEVPENKMKEERS
ncbi:MAG: 5-formyltetrahydrofolate cyclo-ligase [Clostridiales bacterium]|nr:5-formyltetrahydrofolate cyclo-ligase [Clostridiales bacterium]